MSFISNYVIALVINKTLCSKFYMFWLAANVY